MIDVVESIKDYLSSEWTETDPGTIHYVTGFPGVWNVEKDVSPVIYIDELPNAVPTKTYQTKGIYKVKHDVVLSIFVRPVNYESTQVSTANTTFRNMMTEIDSILNSGRYNLNYISEVELGEWKFETDREEEPITFKASQIIHCYYYITETDFSQSAFPFIFLT